MALEQAQANRLATVPQVRRRNLEASENRLDEGGSRLFSGYEG